MTGLPCMTLGLISMRSVINRERFYCTNVDPSPSEQEKPTSALIRPRLSVGSQFSQCTREANLAPKFAEPRVRDLALSSHAASTIATGICMDSLPDEGSCRPPG